MGAAPAVQLHLRHHARRVAVNRRAHRRDTVLLSRMVGRPSSRSAGRATRPGAISRATMICMRAAKVKAPSTSAFARVRPRSPRSRPAQRAGLCASSREGKPHFRQRRAPRRSTCARWSAGSARPPRGAPASPASAAARRPASRAGASARCRCAAPEPLELRGRSSRAPRTRKSLWGAGSADHSRSHR